MPKVLWAGMAVASIIWQMEQGDMTSCCWPISWCADETLDYSLLGRINLRLSALMLSNCSIPGVKVKKALISSSYDF